jgi:hypothetical protein
MVDNSLLLIYNSLLVVYFDVLCYSKDSFYNRRVKIMKTKNNFRGILAKLPLALAAVLIFALAGCGDHGGGGDGNTTYTVTLKRADINAAGVTLGETEVEKNAVFAKPSQNFAGEGEELLGWFPSLDLTGGKYPEYDFSSPVVKDTVIYARFGKQKMIQAADDGGRQSVRDILSLEQQDATFEYYSKDGDKISLRTPPSSKMIYTGFYMTIRKFEDDVAIPFVFENETYVLKNVMFIYDTFGFVPDDHAFTTENYFERRFDGVHISGGFGDPIDYAMQLKINVLNGNQKIGAFARMFNMHGYRVKSLSSEALELTDDFYFTGGTYYRLKPFTVQ